MATKRGKLRSIIFNTFGNEISKKRGEGNKEKVKIEKKKKKLERKIVEKRFY